MRLYRIIIVDDEEEIRLGVKRKINWEEYGFEVVGDAENGQEALELAEKIKPDIIMTDIKMPFLDGLQLAEKIKYIMPSTKIIIFSGSDDLEYAHKAIKLNVSQYVLKPINSLELIEVLLKLKEQLDKEYNEKKDIEVLKNYYKDTLPVIREQYLVSAIEGRITKEHWEQEAKRLGLDFLEGKVVVATIGIDGKAFLEETYNENVGLVLISIKNIVDEILNKSFKFISLPYLDKIIILFSLKDEDEVIKIIRGISEAVRMFEVIFSTTISAGIGRIYEDVENIRYSYKSSEIALSYKQILGLGRAIYIEDVEPNENIILVFEEEEEKRLNNTIKMLGKEEISEVYNDLFRKLEGELISLSKYRIYVMEIMTSILKLISIYNLNVDEILGSKFNFNSYVDDLDSINEVRDFFIDKSIKINKKIKKERVNSSRLLIEKAKEYIEKNYMETDLSVESICSILHVSPTYFSSVFKKETEMNFVNYLTDIRLDRAINLLNTTDDKTYIIAGKVGYQEANYFSYVFKKKYGMSPSRYRKS